MNELFEIITCLSLMVCKYCPSKEHDHENEETGPEIDEPLVG